jgi:hypothetical protein
MFEDIADFHCYHRTDPSKAGGRPLPMSVRSHSGYEWAERRRLETHPKTGAAPLVEICKTVKEVLVPVYVQPAAARVHQNISLFLPSQSDDELLGYGVPKEWLHNVKQVTEDTLLALTEHLPAEAAEALLELATGGKRFKILDEHVETTSGYVSIGTMHLAKGLEFRAVVVMACDDEIIPLQEHIETVGEDADLQEVYDTERHLLYVARTRARDHLLVTGVDPVSEFLDDIIKGVPAG